MILFTSDSVIILESMVKDILVRKVDRYCYLIIMVHKLKQKMHSMMLCWVTEVHWLISCFVGQEAICIGMEAAITKSDAVITSYRAHGWTYVRGATVRAVIAELMGSYTSDVIIPVHKQYSDCLYHNYIWPSVQSITYKIMFIVNQQCLQYV